MRAALCALLCVDFWLNAALKEKWWWSDLFGILASILSGGIISFLFYFLIVLIPERRKKPIIKNNLQRMYRNIKKHILWQVIFASIRGGRADLNTSPDLIDELMDTIAFKSVFEHG
jgi:hypothetical protein